MVFPAGLQGANDINTKRDSEIQLQVGIVDRDLMSSNLLAMALSHDKQLHAFAIQSSNLISVIESTEIELVVIGAEVNCESRSGFDLAHAVSRTCPRVRILMLLNRSSRGSVIRAFRSGARAVVTREQAIDELLDCIDHVQRGFIWAGGQEASFLLQAFRDLPIPQLPNTGVSDLLTDREFQVVKHAATGKTNKMIATELCLSEHTVKNYLFRAFDKLGVSSRVELLFYLAQNGHNLGSAAYTDVEAESA